MSNEPVIGYRSILSALNVSDNGVTVPGFPVAALANGLTYDRWRFYAGASPTLYIDAGAAVSCDYLGFASHTFADNLALIRVFTCTAPGGVGAVLRATYAPTTNAPALVLFAPVSSRYWMVTYAPSLGTYATADVGALYLGARLTFERCLMKSHAPGPLNRVTDFYDNASESGQFLGRSIMRRGFATEVAFDMATAAWVRSEFQPFVKAARLSPYFFAWNPQTYPDEVVFGRTEKDIGVDYTGDRDRMKTTFAIQGLGFDD